MEDSEVKT
jgi:predicted phosphodiesterase